MAGWSRLFQDAVVGDDRDLSAKKIGDGAVPSHEDLVRALDDAARRQEENLQGILAAEACLLKAVVSKISSSARACKRGYRFPSAVPI